MVKKEEIMIRRNTTRRKSMEIRTTTKRKMRIKKQSNDCWKKGK